MRGFRLTSNHARAIEKPHVPFDMPPRWSFFPRLPNKSAPALLNPQSWARTYSHTSLYLLLTVIQVISSSSARLRSSRMYSIPTSAGSAPRLASQWCPPSRIHGEDTRGFSTRRYIAVVAISKSETSSRIRTQCSPTKVAVNVLSACRAIS